MLIPTTIIAEMLGVPVADRRTFSRWSKSAISATASGLGMLKMIPSVMALMRYIRKLVNARRTDPRDDLISALVQAEDAGDQLSEDELVAMVFLLLLAGHETTVNLIGNGTLALLEHPDQMAKLRNDPALIKAAVEELLRYASPVDTATERFAREDVTIAGVTIPRGEQVFAVLASANRDEQQFANPDTLDITREPNKHLAFGLGIHYCLGAGRADRDQHAAAPRSQFAIGRCARIIALATRISDAWAGSAARAVCRATGDDAHRVARRALNVPARDRYNARRMAATMRYPNGGATMADKRIFRIMFALLFLAMAVIRVYYRVRARQERGQVSYKEPKLQAVAQALIGVAGLVANVAVVFAPRRVAWAALPLPAWLRWFGVGLGATALGLLVWVQRALGRNFSTVLHVREGHTLVTNGPYRWARHPMYTVIYLVIASWVLVSANWLVGLIWGGGLTAVLLVRVRHEEAIMLDTFGEQYRRYMQRTGRFLPRLKR